MGNISPAQYEHKLQKTA
ncbi:hypothetical protein [Moellerella wisconsensis]